MSMILPVVSSVLGSALTADDWKRIGIKAVSLYLEALLVRPGLETLKTLSSMGAYIGWNDQPILLNASNLVEKAGTYTIRSPFDGSRLTYSEAVLLDVVEHLKPTYLLLPSVKWYAPLAHTEIQLFVPFHESSQIQDERVGHWTRENEQTILFSDKKNIWKETEKPMLDALNGVVYGQNKMVFDVRKSEMATVFRSLAEQCACEACQTGLTIAYFHHLFEHTPGLCQRFLTQHNFYMFCTSFA